MPLFNEYVRQLGHISTIERAIGTINDREQRRQETGSGRKRYRLWYRDISRRLPPLRPDCAFAVVSAYGVITNEQHCHPGSKWVCPWLLDRRGSTISTLSSPPPHVALDHTCTLRRMKPIDGTRTYDVCVHPVRVLFPRVQQPDGGNLLSSFPLFAALSRPRSHPVMLSSCTYYKNHSGYFTVALSRFSETFNFIFIFCHFNK